MIAVEWGIRSYCIGADRGQGSLLLYRENRNLKMGVTIVCGDFTAGCPLKSGTGRCRPESKGRSVAHISLDSRLPFPFGAVFTAVKDL